MSFLDESERLHARVRGFARRALAGQATEPFDALALDIARYQVAYIPGFRRLVDAERCPLTDAASIPAVPVDAFRLIRVAVHPPELDAVRFVTSGTTSGAQGMHPMRTTETYRELSLAWGVPALTRGRAGRRVVVALAPDPGPRITSSLAFMMRALMETLDGRSLRDGSPSGFDADVQERWLIGPGGADVEGLARAASVARARNEPLLVLATSFALVLFADACDRRFELPDGSAVMTTGGFKGKSREVTPDALAQRLTELFGIDEASVVGEYGMTELTSQLYERTDGSPDFGGLTNGAPRKSGAHLRTEVLARGFFGGPPWLRVTAVDPETLDPVREGEAGIARFVDLGNVDSAVAIVTQDVIRVAGGRLQLLGRRQGAPPRGCSLAIEEMVLGKGTG